MTLPPGLRKLIVTLTRVDCGLPSGRNSPKNAPARPSATNQSGDAASMAAAARPPFQNRPAVLEYIARSTAIGTELWIIVENSLPASPGTWLAKTVNREFAGTEYVRTIVLLSGRRNVAVTLAAALPAFANRMYVS